MTVSPPRPKGPHLNALRAFESAARLGSFTAAADELCITAGAISQHIKSLEAWTESELFVRNARGVELSPLGEELLPRFTDAFDQLNDAVQALRTTAAPNKIRIATLPAVAQLWLSERLGNLRNAVPEIRISVYAVETCPNLDREPYDVTIFFEDVQEISEGEVLFTDRIFPVCTPQIAARLSGISDLKNETLLHDSAWVEDWFDWLQAQGERQGSKYSGPKYSLYSVAVEEALNGAGILMAHEALVAKYLKDGRLIAPFDNDFPLKRSLVMKGNKTFRNRKSFGLLAQALKQ